MAARGAAKRSVAAPRRNGRGWFSCMAAVLLAVAGCSSGSTTQGSSPSNTSGPAPQTPLAPSSRGATASLSKPVSDAELVAIINGVGQTRNLPFPAAHDSASLRSGAVSGSFPSTKMETTPGDCLAFVPQDPFARWADKDIGFAEGGMPPAGGESGPTTTIMIILRSADKDTIAKADFGYADDLVSRCRQFDLAYTEAGRTSTSAFQLLAAPQVGEKQHGFMQVTKPTSHGDIGTVGLRVLDGTLSITLSLGVASLNSESDAKPALEAMAGLAKELIDQAGKGASSVAAPPPNSLTPDRLVALFKGITGPNGEPVSLPQATVLGPPPGFTPGASSQRCLIPLAPSATRPTPPRCLGPSTGRDRLRGPARTTTPTSPSSACPRPWGHPIRLTPGRSASGAARTLTKACSVGAAGRGPRCPP